MIRARRAFLRRLIDLLTTANQLQHCIHLNVEARSDIEWWFTYISPWNGKTILTSHINQLESMLLYTDASGSWGCGAVWGPHWLQLEWAGLLRDTHISTKELTPIVIAAAAWGHYWRGKSIKVLSDNSAAVAAINNQFSRVQEMAHMLRCLAFICGCFQIQISVAHVPGVHNTMADALSRNNMTLFRSLCPQASGMATTIPSSLIQLLLVEKTDWTSEHWTTL